MGIERQIRLEHDDTGQMIHLPADLALPGEEAVISKLGNGVIIRPTRQKTTSDLLDWLKTIEPWDEEFPDVDEGLLPVEDVDL